MTWRSDDVISPLGRLVLVGLRKGCEGKGAQGQKHEQNFHHDCGE